MLQGPREMPEKRRKNSCGIIRADPNRDGVGNQRGIWDTRLGRRVVRNYCGIRNFSVSGRKCVYRSADGGFPAPLGVGEFGGVTEGRSLVYPAPLVSTDPKHRLLGAVVALCDRDRKLYPDPGGRVGTSEAEADPKTSGWSMDQF